MGGREGFMSPSPVSARSSRPFRAVGSWSLNDGVRPIEDRPGRSSLGLPQPCYSIAGHSGATGFRQGRGEMRHRTVVLCFALLAALGLSLSISPVRASSDVSGQGTTIWKAPTALSSVTISDCAPVPSTDLTTCTFHFTGVWFGTISGPLSAVEVVTEEPSAGSPAGGMLMITGTVICSPCTVAGLTGSLSFSDSLSGIEARTPLDGSFSITGGTGDLAGASGSGTLVFPGDGLAPPLPYSIAITLP